MRERGHDLLGHGWRWTEPWTQSARRGARAHLRARSPRSSACSASGRSAGTRARSPSENTRELLLEAGGFLYDSDAYKDDVPYYDRSSARRAGRPVLQDLQRRPLPHDPGLLEPARLPRHARDGPRPARPRGSERRAMMTVVVHARWSGQAARAAAMRMFIEHAQATPGVRFMRGGTWRGGGSRRTRQRQGARDEVRRLPRDGWP